MRDPGNLGVVVLTAVGDDGGRGEGRAREPAWRASGALRAPDVADICAQRSHRINWLPWRSSGSTRSRDVEVDQAQPSPLVESPGDDSGIVSRQRAPEGMRAH